MTDASLSANGLSQAEPEVSALRASIPCAERFYIDCEFDGHGGPLLSIALVPERGASIYIKTTAPVRDDWVYQNVLPLMDSHLADYAWSVSLNDVGKIILTFIGACEHPVIIADSPVDIARFCQAISTSNFGGWASVDYPLMTFEVHNVDCYPTDLPGAVQHNAWWDAMTLRHKLAQGMSAGTAKTEGLGAQPASPVGNADAPNPQQDAPE